MNQPPNSSPDNSIPDTGATAGARPAQPMVPPLPPLPSYGQQPQAPQTPWDQQATQVMPPAPSWQQQQPQAPTWGQEPQQTSPFGTYAAPYSQPQYPQYGQYPGTLPPQKKTLGVVALVFALIASLGSAILALALGGPAIRRFAEFQEEFGAITEFDITEIDLSYFASVRDSVLWLEISLWIGTIAGITAIVLGIIASVQRKGRGYGIAALVLGITGFIFWAVGAAIGGIMAGMPLG